MHLKDTISDDKHFSCHFALPADQVARGEYVRTHLKHKVMEELRLALLEDCHFLQSLKVDMERQLCLELIRKTSQRRIDIASTAHTAAE